MSNQDTNTDLKHAFKVANDILALEGFIRTPEVEQLQQRVINGELTVDQAVEEVMKQYSGQGKGGAE